MEVKVMLNSLKQKILLLFFVACIGASCSETGSTMSYYSLSDQDVLRFKKMASEGNGEAALALSKYYEYSELSPQQSLQWLQVAAKNNNRIGMYNYGVYLLHAVPPNKEEARYWFERGDKQGDILAKQRLQELEKMDEE